MKIDTRAFTPKFKIVDQDKMKAIVSLDFDGMIIKGFRVMTFKTAETKEPTINLLPPSYRDGNSRYHPIFYLTDKDEWEWIEAKVLEEYKKECAKLARKKFGIRDDDDIINNI